MKRRQFIATSIGSIAGLGAVTLLDTFSPQLAMAEPKTAASIGDAVQGFYDNAKTYKATFKQRYWIEAFGSYRDSSGSVTFQKPGKMRWVYTNNGNVVVSNGKELKVYEKENKQMYLQTVNETQYPAALSFLLGNGSLSKTFDLKMMDSKKLQFPGGYVLLGTPKAATPAYQRILFYIDAKTYQVRRVLLIDAQRNRNRFDFEGASVNVPVNAGLFSYTPPRGTRVIRP